MFALFLSTSSYASAERYYDSAIGLTKFELKTKLSQIVSTGHKDQGYSALYNYYFISDRDQTYENDGSILDIYSENPRGVDPYNFKTVKDRCGAYKVESDCFNREHLFPQGTFGKSHPMRSDFFHIFPTDGKVNNIRGSLPFGEVSRASKITLNGSKRGQSKTPGYSGEVFEPIDEFKGDVARALLYFGTRYENKIAHWNHPMLSKNKNTAYAKWFVRLLLKWHKQDPVSQHERVRNEYGYKFQGNRNPFIDHPEYAEQIWL